MGIYHAPASTSMSQRGICISSEEDRLRRHIENLNEGTDYDSEYANHPPPTDSEIEPEIALTSGRNYIDSLDDPAPEYLTEEPENSVQGNLIISQHSHRNWFINMETQTVNANATSITNSNSNSRLRLSNHSYNNSASSSNLRNDLVGGNLVNNRDSTASVDLYYTRNKLKLYGLKRLSVTQRIIVSICRDLPLYSILINLCFLLSSWYKLMKNPYGNLTTVRATEFFLASLWCLVSCVLSFNIVDGMMVRWMLIYDIQAVIIRILSMSLIIILIIEMMNYTFNNSDNEFCLTVWILISCVLTFIFIVQCFWSNNLIIEDQLKRKRMRNLESRSLSNHNINGDRFGIGHNDNSNAGVQSASQTNTGTQSHQSVPPNDDSKVEYKRRVDFYNLVVYAVVPIGVASFISTIGLVRLLLILRLDIGMEITRIQQGG